MEKQQNKAWGGLWLTKSKTSDKSPDLTGNAQIEGKFYELAVWKQLDRTNNKPDYKICLTESKPKTADKVEDELN